MTARRDDELGMPQMVLDLEPDLQRDDGTALSPDKQRRRVDPRELRSDVGGQELPGGLKDGEWSRPPGIRGQDGQEADRRVPQSAEQAGQVAQVALAKREHRGVDQHEPRDPIWEVRRQLRGDEAPIDGPTMSACSMPSRSIQPAR